jgi:predicted glycoside hydrolase/deacetylase ChbG (UPF0249 family)
MLMKQIVRHSDDLGITFQSTNHILESWQAGHLDSFSIIANGDATDQIPLGLAAAGNRKIKIAIHFNLTEGRSTAPPEEVPLLVNEKGDFRHTFASLVLASILSPASKKKELFRQIAIECSAQIREIRSLCGKREVRALDGHNHIHMIPGIFNRIAQIAKKEGLSEIRIAFEPFYVDNLWHDWRKLFWWINLIKHLLLKFLSIHARQVARRLSLVYPDAIIGVLYSGRMTASRALRGIETANRANNIQVIFHIGRAHIVEAKRWRRSTYAAFHLSEWRDKERSEIGSFSDLLNESTRLLKG